MPSRVDALFASLESAAGVVAPADPYVRSVARLAYARGQSVAAKEACELAITELESALERVHSAVDLFESWCEVEKELAMTAEISRGASPWLSPSQEPNA